ncbi:hypothetical protein RO3G_01479 [Rhizopus delemar RA 99-880]|uniref:rhizopuspepsin n=1 Tax=Rhizopus delemar (strain RA 99-880 / ATCC MYA-4621 / FGSC 9543 / NRRL 43880) TaxID=246409 RepID=I1BKP5_RHIO9|nr:hypothetical protein RO3G_01479 [Rhizopus delemar RA 99-880]|eukprot:EIE76775.1 hypothetical protein RO3G_01479 [Rhizopus delemar RA 99-880]
MTFQKIEFRVIRRAAIFAFMAIASIDANIIRAPIIRNHNANNIYELAKKRHQLLSKRSFKKRDSHTASLYNDQGSQYLIQVNIGTPAQTFTVTLDTGSIPYGIGNVNGTYAKDTVTIGGATVSNQQFGLATATSDILESSTSTSSNSVEANGILGLGYPSLTESYSQGNGGYNPFVFNLVSQNIISDPIFSIYLNSISQTGWAGEIIFGGTDPTKYEGDLAYLPVVGLTSKTSGIFGGSSSRYYYWMVYGQGLGVTNSSTGSNPSYSLGEVGTFILDTGTTLTYLPTTVATEIVAAFAGSNGYSIDSSSGVFIVDCSVYSSSARFELKMAQSSSSNASPVTLSVPASQLVIPMDSTDVSTASVCMFGIAPLSGSGTIGSNMYLVGDSVLRSAYMVFDIGNNRIGLAASKGVGGTVTSPNGTSADSSSNKSARMIPIITLVSITLITSSLFM